MSKMLEEELTIRKQADIDNKVFDFNVNWVDFPFVYDFRIKVKARDLDNGKKQEERNV